MFKVVRVLLLGGLVGKVLGVLRELIFAWLFGTGTVASAFRLAQAAFLIPLHGFVSETVNGGFTPQFAAARHTTPQRASALFSGLYTVMTVVSVLVAAALWLGAPMWVALLAPGFDAARATTAVTMLQVLALALPAYVVSSLFASVDLAAGRGQLNAARASLQSLGLIAGTLAASWLGIPALIAAGFVVAYLVLLVMGARVVLREGLSLRLVQLATPETKAALLALFKVIRVLIWIPIAFQVNSVLERRMASNVSADAMAALDYARFVSDTLVILVAMPFGLAGLSTMAAMSDADFRQATLRAFRALLYAGLPLSALLHGNAQAIVALVFERGAFGASSVVVTAHILSGLAIGIWGLLLTYAGAKFLTARGRNMAALVASLAGVGCSALILVLARPAWGTGVIGAAAAAQGLVSGGMVVWQLRVHRALAVELASLTLLAIGYGLLVAHVAALDSYTHPVTSIVFTATYWLVGLFGLPWHRTKLISAVAAVRARL